MRMRCGGGCPPPTKKAETEKSIILAIPLSTSVTMYILVTTKGNEK